MCRLLALLTVSALWGAPKIVVDGRLLDWAGVQRSFSTSKPNEPLRSISVTADAERIFILVEFAEPTQINNFPGKMTLLANCDSAATGARIDGLPGVDVAFDFSPGAAVTVFDNGAASPAKTGVQDLGLTKSPAFASQRVELGFLRGRMVGNRKNLFSARVIHWRFVLRDESQRVIQEGQFISRVSPYRQPLLSEPKHDPLARSPKTDFRVVVWNVHNRFLHQNPEPYRRILRALQPDIILLDEVDYQTGEEWMRSFLRSLRPDEKEWNLVISKSGGWERCLVATYLPLSPAFDEVRHSSETINSLGPAVEPFLPKKSPPRKDLNDGVTAAGAFVTIRSKTLLATALDLACCGARPGSLQEQWREAEASVIAERLRSTTRSRPVHAVLTAGDFNLISTRRALDILRSNFDPRGGDLAEDTAVRLNGWESSTTSFEPGTALIRTKLDYLLYSPSSITLRTAFVFNSEELAPKWQLRHDIKTRDSAVTDHLALVADFGWTQ